ncbi:hypothetical protein [Thiobacillus denitrificans]|uniref:hypothetical protein n=1 Tax=Thiobacillus denitrificans TaxID=36861 RepID=UPI0012FC161A|nr:hypothetical protein [Thiobacillus denitrificans]
MNGWHGGESDRSDIFYCKRGIASSRANPLHAGGYWKPDSRAGFGSGMSFACALPDCVRE